MPRRSGIQGLDDEEIDKQNWKHTKEMAVEITAVSSGNKKGGGSLQ
jgi:hypothetical protein